MWGRQAVRGGRCPLVPFPHLTPRKLQSGSLSSSETCLLPMKRTCFCKTRYGGRVWGQVPGRPGAGLQGRGQSFPPSVPVFQVDELERKVKSQQDQLFLTRQELTNTAAELKMRAVQAEGGHTRACHWVLRTKAPRGVLPTLFPCASRTPGTGEEEVPAELGGRGTPALQGGASLVVSSGLCSPRFIGACRHFGVAWCPQGALLARLPSTTLGCWWHFSNSPGRCQTQNLPTSF